MSIEKVKFLHFLKHHSGACCSPEKSLPSASRRGKGSFQRNKFSSPSTNSMSAPRLTMVFSSFFIMANTSPSTSSSNRLNFDYKYAILWIDKRSASPQKW